MQYHEFREPSFGHCHGGAENSLTIGLAQCALPNDHDTTHAFFVGMVHLGQLFQGRAVGAKLDHVIRQIRLRPDPSDTRPFEPCLADTRIQNRCLFPWVRADEQDHLGIVDLFNRGVADIAGAVARWQLGPVRAAFDVAAHAFDHLLEAERRFGGGEITHQSCNLLALHRVRRSRQSFGPACFAQLSILTNVGCVQTLAAQAIPNKARLVGNPFLIHAVMIAREEAHDFTAFGVHANVGAKRIHHVDGFCFGQFPRTGGESVGLRHKRPDRAEVDDVALQVAVERFAQIAGDLSILATACLTHLADAGDFGREADAAGARDAARHVGFNERSKIEVIHRPLGLTEAGEVDAVRHRLVLQVAFATLVADRAIKRVVDEQKLHHPFAGLFHHR